MKYTPGSIKLGSKTYNSVEADYDSYNSESKSITLGNKTYSATMNKGIESEEEEQEE